LSVNPFDPRVSRQDDEAIAPPDESTWGKGKKKKKKKVSPGINTSAVVPGCGAGFRGDGKNRKIKIVKCKATSKRRAEKKKEKKREERGGKKKGEKKEKKTKRRGERKDQMKGNEARGAGAKGRRGEGAKGGGKGVGSGIRTGYARVRHISTSEE